MIDYRQLYLFRVKKRGDKIQAIKDIAVTLPFAAWHERRLHHRYRKDRYADVRTIPKHQHLQRICKIGISVDANKRCLEFTRNPASGRTETFAFTPIQQSQARQQIRWYWLRWQLLRWAAIIGLTLWLLSEPWT